MKFKLLLILSFLLISNVYALVKLDVVQIRYGQKTDSSVICIKIRNIAEIPNNSIITLFKHSYNSIDFKSSQLLCSYIKNDTTDFILDYNNSNSINYIIYQISYIDSNKHLINVMSNKLKYIYIDTQQPYNIRLNFMIGKLTSTNDNNTLVGCSVTSLISGIGLYYNENCDMTNNKDIDGIHIDEQYYAYGLTFNMFYDNTYIIYIGTGYYYGKLSFQKYNITYTKKSFDCGILYNMRMYNRCNLGILNGYNDINKHFIQLTIGIGLY